jgi:predicted GH43/DUF377 family glycosyl hydrolase
LDTENDTKIKQRAEYMFKRYKKNPILTAKDLPIKAFYVLNPGAVKFGDEYLILADVFHPEGGIIFWLARSKNGYDFTFDPEPVSWPKSFDYWPEHGVYDPRISQIGDKYYIMYGSHANGIGTRIGIVVTEDFVKFSRISVASEIGNRNGVLFPEKINGKYCRLDRPFGDPHAPCDMWLSYSSDLVYWGESRRVIQTRPAHWDSFKLGPGAVPVRVKEGWLELYHGVSKTCSGMIYSIFAAILDADDPSKVIARSKYPLIFPEEPYEVCGRVPNVVFLCNAIVEPDGMVKIYYGAADTCIGMAEAKLDNIVESCFEDYQFMMH